MGAKSERVIGGLAGGLVVAVLMAGLPAVAGDGDPMYVGSKNAGKTVTRLNTRGGLRVDNFKAGNPALILNVTGATPPIAVNSDEMVENLNADLLDGMDASAFAGADEGLMGGYYELGHNATMTVFSGGPFQLDMKCVFVAGGSPPPPSYALRLELSTTAGGYVWYRTGHMEHSFRSMYDGAVETWTVAQAYTADIGEIYALAISDDGNTLLRLVGVGWADYDDATCYAALQFVPFPQPELGPPLGS